MSIEYANPGVRSAKAAAIAQEFAARQGTIERLTAKQNACRKAYDETVLASIPSWDDVREAIEPVIDAVVEWCRGTTGEPLPHLERPSHHGFSFPVGRGGWFVAGNPPSGWIEVGYHGEYASASDGLLVPDRTELENGGDYLRSIVTVNDWWIGGGNSDIGFCCRTDAISDPPVKLPKLLAELRGY